MKITEVSKKIGLSNDTLRYYEKIGLIDPIEKDESGRRYYTDDDLSRINFLKCMRAAGVSIENLKLYIDMLHEGEHTIPKRKELLIKQRESLDEKINDLVEMRSYLNNKIENYEETLVKKELEKRRQLNSSNT